MAWYAYEHTYLGHFMMMEPTERCQALDRTGLHFFFHDDDFFSWYKFGLDERMS